MLRDEQLGKEAGIYWAPNWAPTGALNWSAELGTQLGAELERRTGR
jgi:hypothetical protein